MQALMSGPHIADLLVLVMLLELCALAWRRPQRLRTAWPNLCAGVGLALALRCALTGAAWHWLALCLLLSGAAYSVELRQRWRL